MGLERVSLVVHVHNFLHNTIDLGQFLLGFWRVEVDQVINDLVHVSAVDVVLIEGPFEAEAEDMLRRQKVWNWIANDEFEYVGEFGVDFVGEVGGMVVEVGKRRGLMGDGVINDELDFVNEEGFVVGGFVVLEEFRFMSV
jgi:hypothetical protein